MPHADTRPKATSARRLARSLSAVVVVATITCLSSLTLASRPDRAAGVPRASATIPPSASGLAAPLRTLGSSNAIADAAEAALPAVVNISASRLQSLDQRSMGPFGRDPMLRRFFGEPNAESQPRTHRSQSLGSGVVVDAAGIVLTNNHVVAGADEIKVTLSDGSEFAAEIVGTDAPTDLAVIRLLGVEPGSLTPLALGDDEQLRLGEIVLAVGNPFGLSGSVTMGIVSAKGRGNVGIVDYEDFIQTDAAINPGNSGGALLNLEGELIGINTAIASRSGGNQGVGFAIPSSLAREIMGRLLEDGVVRRSWLGVSIQPFTPAMARAFGAEGVAGVLVSGVQGDSPASGAGIEAGDVILSFAGERVESPSELRNAVALSTSGKPRKLKVLRGGAQKIVEVILSEKDPKILGLNGSNNDGLSGLDGLELEGVRDLDDRIRRQMRVAPDVVEGVLVRSVSPSSSAASSGLQAGDVIVELNRKKVAGLKDLRELASQSSEFLVARVMRGEASLFLLLT
jgi:serine protease Do